jgi:hypothetical protein
MSNIIKVLLLITLLAVGGWLWSLRPIERMDLIGHVWAEPMTISFDNIKQGYNEDDMRKEFHYLKFTCQVNDSQPRLGDQACWSYIKSINGVPAKYVVFFSKNNIVSHIRITVKGDHHKDAYSIFEKKYGNPELVKRGGDVFGENIRGWMLPTGFLAMSENVTPDKEATILWTSLAGQHFEMSSPSSGPTSKDYASTLFQDCKNAYTASVAYTVDHPNAKNITLSNLIESGYAPSEGVTTTLDNLSYEGGTITCSGPDAWGVSAATVTIINNIPTFTQSRPISEESAASAPPSITPPQPLLPAPPLPPPSPSN